MTLRILDFADGFTSANAPTEIGGYKISTNQAISAAGQIVLNTSMRQVLKVSGNAAAITTANAPFTTTPNDGLKVILEGTDGTNTVTIPYADVAGGCLLNGDRTLGLGDTLTLYYNATDDRYYEESRNA